MYKYWPAGVKKFNQENIKEGIIDSLGASIGLELPNYTHADLGQTSNTSKQYIVRITSWQECQIDRKKWIPKSYSE